MNKCIICGNINHLKNTPIGCLCGKHSSQYYKYGKVLKRTRADRNEIVENEDGTFTICLYNKKHECIGKALIDKEDIELVKPYKWGFDGCYARTTIPKNGKSTILYLHRLLMNIPIGVVDHINGNKLDNRRCNLRVCTTADNVHNRTDKATTRSGIHGISWVERISKWHVRICINYKQKHIGYYANIEDAIEARKRAEKEYFGKYSHLNRKEQDV